MTVAENMPAKPIAKKTAGIGLDVPLLLSVGALLLFGLMMVYSSTFDWSYRAFGNPAEVFLRQLMWAGVGLTGLVITARIDYHRWRMLALPLMGVTVLLLLWVLLFGTARFNAQRALFNGSVQPSELAKFAIIIYLSVWLASKGEKIRTVGYGLIPFGVIVGFLFGLIILQPDLSAGITIVVIASLLFFVAGADWKQILMAIVVGALTVAILVQLPISAAETGRQRLSEYIVGLQDIRSASWHVQQAAVAFVQGGWFGRGLGQSHQKFIALPTPHTDSIFAIIGEELGLFGCAIVIALFSIFIWRGYKIAAQARDALGASLAAGIVCWIAFEALVNIAVMVGAMPFAGNALPFISYGGSNLVMTLVSVGVLLNIARRTEAEPLLRRSRFVGAIHEEARREAKENNAAFDFSRRDGRRRISRPGRK